MYAYVMAFQRMLFSKRLTAKLTVKPFFCIMHFSHMTIQPELVGKLFATMGTNNVFGFVTMNNFGEGDCLDYM